MINRRLDKNTPSTLEKVLAIFIAMLILFIILCAYEVVLENIPRYLRVKQVDNDTYEVKPEPFNPKGKIYVKGGPIEYDKKDATFQVSKDTIPPGMYQFIPTEEACDSMIYVSKTTSEYSFIPDVLHYTIGRSYEPEVIYLPANSEVKVKSSSCKKSVRLKKSAKLNYITKLPVEQYGLSKVPAKQKELKVNIKKNYYGENMYGGNSRVVTFNKDKLISYKFEDREYYKTEYLIKNSDLQEYRTKSESYDTYLKTHSDFSIKLLDKTFVKTDYVR